MTWKSSICDPCCTPDCGLACFIPFFYFGSNVQMMEDAKIEMEWLDMISFGGKMSKSSCACFCYALGFFIPVVNIPDTVLSSLLDLLAFMPFLLHMNIRGLIRKKYNLQNACCCETCDSQCDDFCVVSFCYSCALIQERIELDHQIKQASPPPQKTGAATRMPRITNSQLISIKTPA